MYIQDMDTLEIIVCHENLLSNDKIGYANLTIKNLKTKGIFKEWIQLIRKGKVTGKLYLEVIYFDEFGNVGGIAPQIEPHPEISQSIYYPEYSVQYPPVAPQPTPIPPSVSPYSAYGTPLGNPDNPL
eukprot:CAMPEP_0205807294 /NCGR_PEP_ID=MMETSP0205-20121125/11020_1 /ASSEMBLY_ACC=CAM_ASM_000278 /TAXON_ID=36767 /ORGANISM="Euplotes focardii, Strain TN1" /LENGTH=126 /DNA_ID=CAMNT_0053081373 /DNA_START=131 /DNA_END=508 /DNA_ORIENTATION=+